jgi:ubiquinone/menaquinone biosynthesis C-methylase UbiE
MQDQGPSSPGGWDEVNSRRFIDYGRYFVPERERQLDIIVDLVPPLERPGVIFELCCGEGLLAEALLERFPSCTVYGFDGSPEMLQSARARLDRFGSRFQALPFDLASRSWRQADRPLHAVVSSLAIHHLDGPQKQALFGDAYRLLGAGGVLVIADVMEPASEPGRQVAAKAWDAAVRARAHELDGNFKGFHEFEREHWNMYRYPEPDDVDKPSRLVDQLKWLEEAGFADVDVYWMLAGHAMFGGRRPE